jgi:hypothetical protein
MEHNITPTAIEGRNYLTRKQIAQLFGLSESKTIRLLSRYSDYLEIFNRRFFPEADIKQFMVAELNVDKRTKTKLKIVK